MSYTPQALFLITSKIIFFQPWLVWLSGLSSSLQTKGSLVQFPVRAHSYVASQVSSVGGQACERQAHIDISLPLSLSLPLCLKLNKIFLKIIFFHMSKNQTIPLKKICVFL